MQAPFGRKQVGLPALAPVPPAGCQKTAARRPSAHRTPSAVPRERGNHAQRCTQQRKAVQLPSQMARQSRMAVTSQGSSSSDENIGCGTADSQTVRQTLTTGTDARSGLRAPRMPAATGPRTLADGDPLSNAKERTGVLKSGAAVASDVSSEPSSGTSGSSATSDSGVSAAERHASQELAARPARPRTPLMGGAHERPRPLPDFLSRSGAAHEPASIQLTSLAPDGKPYADARCACRAIPINRSKQHVSVLLCLS